MIYGCIDADDHENNLTDDDDSYVLVMMTRMLKFQNPPFQQNGTTTSVWKYSSDMDTA